MVILNIRIRISTGRTETAFETTLGGGEVKQEGDQGKKYLTRKDLTASCFSSVACNASSTNGRSLG
jgi:hypothetical protein